MRFVPDAVVAVELEQLSSYSDGPFSLDCPTVTAMLGQNVLLLAVCLLS
jgi:hypothetical protein